MVLSKKVEQDMRRSAVGIYVAKGWTIESISAKLGIHRSTIGRDVLYLRKLSRQKLAEQHIENVYAYNDVLKNIEMLITEAWRLYDTTPDSDKDTKTRLISVLDDLNDSKMSARAQGDIIQRELDMVESKGEEIKEKLEEIKKDNHEKGQTAV